METLLDPMQQQSPDSTIINWSAIKHAILDSCNKFIPKARIPTKPSPRWFNPEIRHQLNKVHTIRRRIKTSPTQHLIAKLSQMEASLQSSMEKSKDDFLQSLTSTFKLQPKKLYGYMNSLSKAKLKPNFIIQNGHSIDDPLHKARCFNEFFNSIFTTSNYSLPSTTSLPTPTTHISKIEIKVEDVYNGLLQLDPTKAMGCDQIHPMILKLCADSVISIAQSLFFLP